MAKVKIAAGAEFDVLTRSEVKEELAAFRANWWSEAQRGDRFRRILLQATVNAAGYVEFGGNSGEGAAGPADGFVWSVKRLAHSGVEEALDLYINDPSPGSYVGAFPNVRYWAFDNGQLVLYPGDTLVAAGTNWTVAQIATLTGAVRELPIALAWRIGG